MHSHHHDMWFSTEEGQRCTTSLVNANLANNSFNHHLSHTNTLLSVSLSIHLGPFFTENCSQISTVTSPRNALSATLLVQLTPGLWTVHKAGYNGDETWCGRQGGLDNVSLVITSYTRRKYIMGNKKNKWNGFVNLFSSFIYYWCFVHIYNCIQWPNVYLNTLFLALAKQY